MKNDDDEIELKVEDLFELLHEACDLAEGKGSQQKLTESEESHVPRISRIKLLRDILANVDVDVEVGDGEDPMEPDAIRFSELLRILDRFQNTNSIALIFDGKGKDGRITSHLLDPGMVAAPIFEEAAGSILMSGTLYPPSMYADILGFTDSTSHAHYSSPFAAKRRPVLIAKNVTTKFSERSQNNTALIQEHIQALVDATPGNVAVFAPSYSMLEQIVGKGQFLVLALSSKIEIGQSETSMVWLKHCSLRNKTTERFCSVAFLVLDSPKGLTIMMEHLTQLHVLAFQMHHHHYFPRR